MIENFNFKKKFGQNFITDKNLLESIIKFSGINEKNVAIEIGAGAGALTEKLCANAKKVISFEIDKDLEPHLQQLFKNQKNLKLIFDDAMKIPNEKINTLAEEDFHLIANLPYYITTPLIFKFLENDKCKSLTVMIQKEVAERIASKEGTKNYGVLSVTIGAIATTKICKIVPKEMFTPTPQVDSAIIHIEKKETNINYSSLKNLVQSAFSMRRKTLQNNLTKSFMTKQEFLLVCDKLKIAPNCRAEQLTIDQFKQLAKEVENLKK